VAGRVSAPDPTGGAYSTPETTLVDYEPYTSKGRGKRKGRAGKGRRGEDKDKVGRTREGKWYPQFLEVTPLQTPHRGGGGRLSSIQRLRLTTLNDRECPCPCSLYT